MMGAVMSPAGEQEAPAPAADLAGLAFFAGSWQAEGTFHATPFSAQKPIRMSIDADVVHRGFWLQTRTAEHPSAWNPNPVTMTCLWGYDTETGRFSAEWFDSNGGRATQTSAGWDDDRLVFTGRSEEHTSELQSQSNLVCRLLLEKKKKTTTKRPAMLARS